MSIYIKVGRPSVNSYPFVRLCPAALSFRRPCKKGYPSRGSGPVLRRNFVAHLVLAVLAFALVSSVGAGVALHQAGYILSGTAPPRGVACGQDHNETNDQAGEGNETGDHNETVGANGTADHAFTPGQGEIRDHNETGDHDNETAEHDDNGTSCEPNEAGDLAGNGDSDTNETKDD